MANLDATSLQRLVDLVDRKLAELPKLTGRSSRKAWQQHELDLIDIIQDLEVQEDASESWQPGSGYVLRMAGIAASSTYGRRALLLNWRNAAQRELGASADPINLAGSGPTPIEAREG